jgi:hypothetical protein
VNFFGLIELSLLSEHLLSLTSVRQQWYVKPTADRGRAEGWMCLASDPPTRPELSRGTCEVWDGDRWTIQTSVTVLTAACAFESMLDVQIFCAEESKALQEKLNATLKRAIGMLSTGINPDRVEEGTKQLDSLLEDLEEQLRLLNQQQMEQEEEASATAKVLENDVEKDKDKERKHMSDVAVEMGFGFGVGLLGGGAQDRDRSEEKNNLKSPSKQTLNNAKSAS